MILVMCMCSIAIWLEKKTTATKIKKKKNISKATEVNMSKHDKSKSGGGLLDIWFGRPKTKGRGGTTNGGRPVSSESDTIGDLQELHNEIMKLTIDEIDQKFIEILEDMNIPKDKRQPLLKKSLDEKRDMILMHFKGELMFCK